MNLTLQFHSEWLHARKFCNSHSTSIYLKHSSLWQKPQQGQIKCNFELSSSFSRAAKIRYWKLHKRLSWELHCSKDIGFWRDSWEAEAWGLMQSIIWIQELSLSNINFESDCKNVVDISSKARGISDFHKILFNGRNLLSNTPNFGEFYWQASQCCCSFSS